MIANVVMTLFVISLLVISAGLTGYVVIKYGDTKDWIIGATGVLVFALMVVDGLILN